MINKIDKIVARLTKKKKERERTQPTNIYQNSSDIFGRNRKDDSKICMEPKKTLSGQSNLEKEKSIASPDFKLHYKAMVISGICIKRDT